MDKRIVIIDEDGEIQNRWTPISPRDKVFTEDLLQKLIFEEPNVLPIEEIDPNYSILIPLGREISVGAGSIDLLFVTPEGLICIVETKLWRNPEAHRTVVAQIIDYAKDLYDISFINFCKAVTRIKNEESIKSLFDIIRKKHRDFDEIELQDKILESLAHGRFLLLIVGDKIRPEVALLTESIHSAPHLEFNLSLAELNFYSMENGLNTQFLVSSRVVGRTLERTRAVVKIRYEEKRPEVEVTATEIEEPPNGRTNPREFSSSMPEGFSDIFLPVYRDWDDSEFIISWGTVGFTVRCEHEGKMNTIIEIYPDNMSIFTDRWVKRKNLPIEICSRFKIAVKNIGAVNRIIKENRTYLKYRELSIGEYSKILSEVDKTIREIIKHYEKL